MTLVVGAMLNPCEKNTRQAETLLDINWPNHMEFYVKLSILILAVKLAVVNFIILPSLFLILTFLYWAPSYKLCGS